MLKPYRTIQDVLASRWVLSPPAERHRKTDRVLRSTKLESSIYHDLRTEDAAMDEIEQDAGKKLKSFPALSQDVFQSFYSLVPRRNEEISLSVAARKFNAPILEHMTKSEEYPTLKEVCEGRELPAYEAASEFISKVSGELDDLLPQLAGKQGALHTLEKLEQSEDQAVKRLNDLLEQRSVSHRSDPVLDADVVKAANEAEGKHHQVAAVTKLIDDSALQGKDEIKSTVQAAVATAAERAKEIQGIIGAWSSEPRNLQRTPENLALLKRVHESVALRDISKYLGRFREILAHKKQNGYTYGRGEKYSLELGSDLSRALTSELAMLAAPETLPMFLRKYQRRQIKQYRRREPVYKGAGDIICCLDESSSTAGECAAWGKAVAMTLLEIAESEGRRFALIHFSDFGTIKTDLFFPKQTTVLLNFFRAEVERRKDEANAPGIIYAIEEPETSQHSENQKKLINALITLSAESNVQVIITTHSAVLVNALDFKNIRLICADGSRKRVEAVHSGQLPFPSLNEVNYLAFSEISEGYHDELYGYLEEQGWLNEYKQGKTTVSYKKINTNGTTREQQICMTEYIRHQIHHPENTYNARFNDLQLRRSIEDMRAFVTSKAQTSGTT